VAKPASAAELEELGRVRLSKHFFMRDMLHSEIAQFHGMMNAPDDAELAIHTGTKLCEELLEPIQERFGRINIRSAYRSPQVNAFGHDMREAGHEGYNCNDNAYNAGLHIWDRRDADGHCGAMACVFIPDYFDAHPEADGWQELARFVDDNCDYHMLFFFDWMWGFNLGWHEKPQRLICGPGLPRVPWTP